MKKILLLFLLLSCGINTRAQVALSYYPVSSYVGISSNPNKLLWADFRMLTNTFASNMNMEIMPMFNLKRDSTMKIYAGVGVNFNLAYGYYNDGQYLNAYTLYFGGRFSPFRKVRNLNFIAEVSPYMNTALFGFTLRTNLGVAWCFCGKQK